MPNLNSVHLMGNLTRDVDLKYTPKGTAVASFGIAINDSYKAQDGTTKEQVTFVDISCFGRQAETCNQFLAKGKPVFIEGRLQLDQWETQTGEKRQKLYVKAERVQFLGGRDVGAARQETPASGHPGDDGAPSGDEPF